MVLEVVEAELELSKLVRMAGWFRIVFGALAMLSMVVKNAKYLDKGGGADAIGFLMELGVGGAGVLAGFALHQVADRVLRRKDYSTCQLGLVVCGMFALCDCGWVVSAPVAIYALVQLSRIRGEFS